MHRENNEPQQVIPQGAIWVKNYKLRQSIGNFISTRNVECNKCHSHFQSDLSEVEEQELNDVIVNHVMTVKLKAVREKFIAIFNPKKSLSTHPDFFLYVYQAYTGAPSVYPFPNASTESANRATFTAQGQGGIKPTPHHSTGTSQSQVGSFYKQDFGSGPGGKLG